MNHIDSYNYRRDRAPLHNKSYAFSVRIVKMLRHINVSPKEYSLTNQLIRAATAIAALVREAEFAQSPLDFINKLSIALKEANETMYWLHLFLDCDLIEQKWFDSVQADCQELIAMLVASIKTTKKRNDISDR